MTVTTFFPSLDGSIVEDTNAVWATIRGATAGDIATPTAATIECRILTTLTTDIWERMTRAIVLFDTNTIPDGDNVDSATFELVATDRAETIANQSASMVTSTPATDTDIILEDYDQLGTTKQATDKTLASFTVDSATYSAFTLNATGLGNISKTGVSRFGFRITSDNDNAEPTWASDVDGRITVASAEEILAGDKRPKLVVTHTLPFVPKALMF